MPFPTGNSRSIKNGLTKNLKTVIIGFKLIKRIVMKSLEKHYTVSALSFFAASRGGVRG
jgi:hypothetical protein